eukprot:3066146-Amphidinium_carterae.1
MQPDECTTLPSGSLKCSKGESRFQSVSKHSHGARLARQPCATWSWGSERPPLAKRRCRRAIA